ncbi:MAG: hypothetical protein ACD_24C00431G0002 [uncultured bacterium]|nr:MAG: hypothetical protein ACD_24C00431G0002 [uncultured bacterium]
MGNTGDVLTATFIKSGIYLIELHTDLEKLDCY